MKQQILLCALVLGLGSVLIAQDLETQRIRKIIISQTETPELAFLLGTAKLPLLMSLPSCADYVRVMSIAQNYLAVFGDSLPPESPYANEIAWDLKFALMKAKVIGALEAEIADGSFYCDQACASYNSFRQIIEKSDFDSDILAEVLGSDQLWTDDQRTKGDKLDELSTIYTDYRYSYGWDQQAFYRWFISLTSAIDDLSRGAPGMKTLLVIYEESLGNEQMRLHFFELANEWFARTDGASPRSEYFDAYIRSLNNTVDEHTHNDAFLSGIRMGLENSQTKSYFSTLFQAAFVDDAWKSNHAHLDKLYSIEFSCLWNLYESDDLFLLDPVVLQGHYDVATKYKYEFLTQIALLSSDKKNIALVFDLFLSEINGPKGNEFLLFGQKALSASEPALTSKKRGTIDRLILLAQKNAETQENGLDAVSKMVLDAICDNKIQVDTAISCAILIDKAINRINKLDSSSRLDTINGIINRFPDYLPKFGDKIDVTKTGLWLKDIGFLCGESSNDNNAIIPVSKYWAFILDYFFYSSAAINVFAAYPIDADSSGSDMLCQMLRTFPETKINAQNYLKLAQALKNSIKNYPSDSEMMMEKKVLRILGFIISRLNKDLELIIDECIGIKIGDSSDDVHVENPSINIATYWKSCLSMIDRMAVNREENKRPTYLKQEFQKWQLLQWAIEGTAPGLRTTDLIIRLANDKIADKPELLSYLSKYYNFERIKLSVQLGMDSDVSYFGKLRVGLYENAVSKNQWWEACQIALSAGKSLDLLNRGKNLISKNWESDDDHGLDRLAEYLVNYSVISKNDVDWSEIKAAIEAKKAAIGFQLSYNEAGQLSFKIVNNPKDKPLSDSILLLIHERLKEALKQNEYTTLMELLNFNTLLCESMASNDKLCVEKTSSKNAMLLLFAAQNLPAFQTFSSLIFSDGYQGMVSSPTRQFFAWHFVELKKRLPENHSLALSKDQAFADVKELFNFQERTTYSVDTDLSWELAFEKQQFKIYLWAGVFSGSAVRSEDSITQDKFLGDCYSILSEYITQQHLAPEEQFREVDRIFVGPVKEEIPINVPDPLFRKSIEVLSATDLLPTVAVNIMNVGRLRGQTPKKDWIEKWNTHNYASDESHYVRLVLKNWNTGFKIEELSGFGMGVSDLKSLKGTWIASAVQYMANMVAVSAKISIDRGRYFFGKHFNVTSDEKLDQIKDRLKSLWNANVFPGKPSSFSFKALYIKYP